MEAVSGGDGRKTMVEAEGAEAVAEAEGVSHSGLPSNIQVNVFDSIRVLMPERKRSLQKSKM
jgi:hypothetical protein